MKLEIIFTILLICLLALSGCITDTDSSEQDNTNNDQDSNGVIVGWYLKEVVDRGDKVVSTHDYYSYDVIYARGNITTILFGDGDEELRIRTTWTAPPEYIEAEGEFSIDVKKEGLVVSIGGLFLEDSSTISIDTPYLELGIGTASSYRLSDETHGEFFKLGQGDEPGAIKEGTFKANAPAANSPFNSEFGLRFQFQNGGIYGTEYVYEWKE